MGILKKYVILTTLAVVASSCIGKNFKGELKSPGPNTLSSFVSFSETLGPVEFFVDNDGAVQASSLKNDKGEYTIMLFSSATCGSCKVEHKDISKRLKGNKPEGVNVFSFIADLNPNNPVDKTDILNWRKDTNVTWPFTGDPTRAVSSAFCPQKGKFPCTVIVSPSGEILLSKIGEFHAKDFDDYIFPYKLGDEPEPPSEFGDAPFFGKYFTESRLFGQKQRDGSIEFSEMAFSSDLERPLLILFASYLCESCEKEHEELVKVYKSGNPAVKNIDIISVVLPYDVKDEVQQKRIQDEWINKFDIPWPVTGLARTEIGKFFENYCKDGNPDTQGFAPCTSLFAPSKGIVMQRYEVSVKTILKQVNTQLKPSFFKETVTVFDGVITDIAEAKEQTKTYDTEKSDKPFLLIYGGNGCESCIEEHKELVELYKDPDSFIHNFEVLSVLVGYEIKNDNPFNGKAALLQSWKVDLGVPWPIMGVPGREGMDFVKKYCLDSFPDNQGIAPCTSVFKPGVGKVFERFHTKVKDIGKVLKVEPVPPAVLGDDGTLGPFTSEPLPTPEEAIPAPAQVPVPAPAASDE